MYNLLEIIQSDAHILQYSGYEFGMLNYFNSQKLRTLAFHPQQQACF